MARKDIVWGGTYAGRQRVLVKAPTKAEAMRRLERAGFRVSRREFDSFWCDTSNEDELRAFARTAWGTFVLVECVECRRRGYREVD